MQHLETSSTYWYQRAVMTKGTRVTFQILLFAICTNIDKSRFQHRALLLLCCIIDARTTCYYVTPAAVSTVCLSSVRAPNLGPCAVRRHLLCIMIYRSCFLTVFIFCTAGSSSSASTQWLLLCAKATKNARPALYLLPATHNNKKQE